MAPGQNAEREEEVDVNGKMPQMRKNCSMTAMHELASDGSSAKASPHDACVSDSASTTARQLSREKSFDDSPPEMELVFKFIQELGAGMDEFKIRIDKFESVLDHLEVDGLRQADEMKELKEDVDQHNREFAKLNDISIRAERCEHETHCLKELMEQRQADLLAAAVADVENICQASLEGYWAEAGVAQVHKACETALEGLLFDLSVIAGETTEHDLEHRRPLATHVVPKPFPAWSHVPDDEEIHCKGLDSGLRDESMVKKDEDSSFSVSDKLMHLSVEVGALKLAEAKFRSVVQHYSEQFGPSGIEKLLEDVGTEPEKWHDKGTISDL